MRGTLAGILLALAGFAGGSVFGQSMLEGAAAAAGGSVGGVAGKKVSDGLNRILGVVDKQTAKAADQGKSDQAKTKASKAASSPTSSDPSGPLFEVGPGSAKPDGSNVPPPPPVHRASIRKPAPEPAVPVIAPPPPPPPVPAPVVTSDNLRQLSNGASREDVMKMGTPSARITMADGGHLVETYRYHNAGSVRLTDGAVSSVQVP
jgi:hypothetical protein